MTPLQKLRAAALFCVLLITGVECIGVAGADVSSTVVVQTTPAYPLLDVVFLATTSIDFDRTLYISSASDCSSRVSPICTLGRAQVGVNYNSTTCIFNVTSASLGFSAATTSPIPALYWCSSATGTTSFATLQMHTVRMSPGYAYYNTETTFSFNQATPVGTKVGLYQESSCDTLLNGELLTTLQSSRELTANIGPRTITHVCASIPTVFNNATPIAVRSVIYGVSPYDIYTTQGVRHRSVAISASSSFHYMSLSTDPQCRTLAQPYQQTETGDGVLTINVPRGTYYFCGVVIRGLEGVGVFVPALSTFKVLEYGIQPHTMYAAHATPMSFSMDAAAAQSSLQGALFTTANCGANGDKPVTSWSTSMMWTVGVTGTYYACVRTSGSTLAADVGYVNQVVVSNIPVVSLARQPAISGLGELATVTRSALDDVPAAVMTVGLSTSTSCATLFTAGNTTKTGNTASFYVPENSPSSIYYCVSNRLTTDVNSDDSSEPTKVVYYPLGPLELRTYGLSYPSLRTEATMTVELDGAVAFGSGTSMCLTPALLSTRSSSSSTGSFADPDSCDAAIDANHDVAMTFQLSSRTSKLTPVRFPVAGSWMLCVREPDMMGGAYVRLRTLRVYGNATVTPDGVISGIPAKLTVTAIPPSTTVSLTTDSTCSTNMPVVTTTQSSLTGTAALLFTYMSVDNLLLCVGYHGENMSQGTVAQLMVAGTVSSTNARVVPSLAVESLPTQLTFSARGASLLSGYTALLVPSSSGGSISTDCPTSATAEFLQLSISLPPSSTTGAVAVATFTPASNTVGTTYLVCAGADGQFVPTGSVTVAAAPVVTTDPSPPAFGLPAYVNFSSAIMLLAQADTFSVLQTTDSCTSDLSIATVFATGSVDTKTGAAQAFVVHTQPPSVTSVRLCVARNSELVGGTLGYADAGVIALTTFTSLTRYAQRGRPNTLVGKPLLSTATLFLVSCTGTECGPSNADTACSSPTANKYTTSSHSPLTAPLGTYFLCQSASSMSAVVGSDTTVEVVEPFQMSLSVDPSAIRAYVPFRATVTGGPGGAAVKKTVVVQPASTLCGETAAESQSFVMGRDPTELVITDIAPVQEIRFCVQASPADSFEVLTGTLQHYMTPAAVIGNRATTLTSGGVTGGATALLSRTADCLSVVAGGGAAMIVGSRVTFTVASCGANGALASLYYCEAVSGGAYASRGTVGLLRSSGCSGGAAASIADVLAAPGAAIGSFGIDTAYLASPRLSASSDCGVLLDAAVARVGYAPGAGESAAFHVCAVLVGDASVTFTTALPTLRVANWAVSPTAAVSRYNATLGAAAATAVRVNYATPSSETFLSTASDCSVRTASAAGLSGSSKTATYSTTGVRGLVYVCTVAPLGGRTLAVAEFLSVTPPAVLRVSPAVVRGGEYSATLVVDGAPPLYSMVPGVDSGYTHSGYYTSTSRNVYLSGDACSSVLAGTSAATVAPSGSVSFATAGIAASVSAVWLCAVTAAGPAAVLADVAVAPGKVYPTTMVSGALGVAVFIPSLKSTAFQLSASASGCGSAAGMPRFTTDAEGYGAVDLVGGNGGALAAGTYTVCYGGAAGRAAMALESVELVRASYFDVRGTTFVVGVASRMSLLQDLTAGALVPGFSTTRDCTSVSSEHGAWAAVTSTSVSVTATSVYTDGLYLCARAPVNGTLVAVPGQWSGPRSVQFVASTMQLPSGGWDACTTYTVNECYPPGARASGATSVVAVVHGDCCSESSRSAVVGKASMASGTCELTLDYDKVSAYPAGSTYHVCVWDSADDSVCTTVGEARVSTDCTRAGGGGGRGLSRGVLTAIILLCVIGGVGVLCGLLWIMWWCCCQVPSEEVVSKSEKGGHLVGFHEFTDDDRLVGYVMSGRNPLLYYPSSSSGLGRSVSASLGYPSITSSGLRALEEVEDEGRDQMALQEARTRYNLRLLFMEGLQLLQLAEKNAAADAAGVDTTYASGDSYLQGVAQPERRRVESILTEEDLMEPEMELPVAAAAAPRHASVNELDLAAFEVPEEREMSLTADANMSVNIDPTTGECHKVRSHSIESAPRRCLSAVESYVTNEDFEEREEESDRQFTAEARIPDSEVSVRMLPQQDAADHGEHRRVRVQHFTKPTSPEPRRSASLSCSGSGSQRRSPASCGCDERKRPHQDPLAAMLMTSEPLPTPKRLRHYIVSPPGGENKSPPDLRTNTAHEDGDVVTVESAIFSHSPIAHAGANDVLEEALPVSATGVRASETIAGHTDSDEDEDDLLSFTTTQRFYDEKRFLLEQEMGRRRRLRNWEEEERAQLMQNGWSSYLSLSSTAAVGGDNVDRFSDHSENTDAQYNAGDKGTARQKGEDEQLYHIPSAPTTLPLLPPAPRPQILQNDRYHVVPTGGSGAS